MSITKHLQEILDKQIPKNRWFTKDDVILIKRTSWVLDRLVQEKALKKEWRFGDYKYYRKSIKPNK